MKKEKMAGWQKYIFFVVTVAAVLVGRTKVCAMENLKTASFTEEENAQFFIAYIYVEDDEENNYNYHKRDITAYFGDYYITAKFTDYADTDLYKYFGIVRINGYLPSNKIYFPSLDVSDSVLGRFSYRVLHNGRDVSSGEGVELKIGNNEFFFVGGFSDFVHGKDGHKKMQELYDQCHTEDGGFYGNKVGSIIEKRHEYESLAEKLNSDPSLDTVEDIYGTVYTRQDLRNFGYRVVPGGSEKETASLPETETKEQYIPSGIPAKKDDEKIGRGDRVFRYSGLLIFLFALPIVAVAVFVIYKWYQWYKRQKSDENTYVD